MNKNIIRFKAFALSLSFLLLFLPNFSILAQVEITSSQECGMNANLLGLINNTDSAGLRQGQVMLPIVAKNYAIHFTIVRDENCTDDRFEVTVEGLKKVIQEINNNRYFYIIDPINGLEKPFINFYFGGAKFVINSMLATVPDAAGSSAFTKDNALSSISPDINAIKVYICKTPFSYGRWPHFLGVIKKPETSVNNANMIVLSEAKISDKVNSFIRELTHELGHYFGLVHTHQDTEPGSNNSPPQNPEFVDGTDSNIRGDKLTDTPADPNAKFCMPNSCNPKFCDNNLIDLNPKNPLPYQPNRFNLMSYYYPTYRCGTSGAFSFSTMQKEIMQGDRSDYWSKLKSGIKHSNRTIFADQNIIPEVIDFHAGKILRARCSNAPISEPFSAKNLSIEVAGAAPLTIPDMTNTCGRYYGQNNILVPNEGKQVKVKPAIDNSNYLENVNIADAFVLMFHIATNGAHPTFTAYQKIAGDVDNNRRLTHVDVNQIRNLVLGKTTVFPAVNSWRYMPGYHETNVPDFSITDPFNHVFKNMPYPNYLDEAKLDYGTQPLDAALYETKAWSFSAIKMGDLSCSPNVVITEPDLITLGEFLNRTTNVSVGTTLSVDVALNAPEDVDAYQFSIAAVPSLKIESVTLGDHYDNDVEEFFHLDKDQNKVNHAWYSSTFATRHFPQGHALYRMKVKVVAPISSLENAFSINQTTMPAYRFGPLHRTMQLNLRAENANYIAPATSENPLHLSVFPNPAYDQVTFSYQLNNQSDVTIIISDNYGRTIQQQNMIGSVGWNEYTTASLNVTPGTILTYIVQSSEGTSRGRILTQE
jgi:hypothetical protein